MHVHISGKTWPRGCRHRWAEWAHSWGAAAHADLRSATVHSPANRSKKSAELTHSATQKWIHTEAWYSAEMAKNTSSAAEKYNTSGKLRWTRAWEEEENKEESGACDRYLSVWGVETSARQSLSHSAAAPSRGGHYKTHKMNIEDSRVNGVQVHTRVWFVCVGIARPSSVDARHTLMQGRIGSRIFDRVRIWAEKRNKTWRLWLDQGRRWSALTKGLLPSQADHRCDKAL